MLNLLHLVFVLNHHVLVCLVLSGQFGEPVELLEMHLIETASLLQQVDLAARSGAELCNTVYTPCKRRREI